MHSNPEVELPAPITSITPQKNNKSRYSIFVDDEFLLGVADSTLLKHQLEKKMQITPALFKQLQRDEGYNEVKNYMLKRLGDREHGREELRRKAERKDYATDVVEDVLYELQEKNYINDERFAQKYAKDKSRLKKWGPNKIKAHLRKKGISRTVADKAAEQIHQATDTEKRLLELTQKREKRFLREDNELKRKQKVVNYLLQKGYRPESIYKHIDKIVMSLKKHK